MISYSDSLQITSNIEHSTHLSRIYGAVDWEGHREIVRVHNPASDATYYSRYDVVAERHLGSELS